MVEILNFEKSFYNYSIYKLSESTFRIQFRVSESIVNKYFSLYFIDKSEVKDIYGILITRNELNFKMRNKIVETPGDAVAATITQASQKVTFGLTLAIIPSLIIAR